MELNNDLITQFAKIAKINTNNKDATTVRGTIHIVDGQYYIRLDGAAENVLTPVETTVEINEGDRVIAAVKDHSLVVTGNKTNPSVGTVTAGNLSTEIEQTATEIRFEAEANYQDLDGKITNEANARANGDTYLGNQITDAKSTFTQRADQIQSTVEANYKTLDGKIDDETQNRKSAISTVTQRADSITTRVEVVEGQNETFSEFKQTVEGFTFMGNGGTVKLTGGDINLTGAITWTDLDSDTKNAIDTAGDEALEKAQEAYNKASSIVVPTLPPYIKSAYIDGARLEAPTIIGGDIYAVGSKPEDENATFTTMDENGFYLYSNRSKADANNEIYPKISMYSNDDTYGSVMFVLGSGESDDYQFHNRFVIEKGGNYVTLKYHLDYSGTTCGFKFNKNGNIDVLGNLNIDIPSSPQEPASLPIGTILLTLSSTNPAAYLAGSWTRVNPAFIYMTSDNGKIGSFKDGGVVTNNVANAVPYLCVVGWQRVS